MCLCAIVIVVEYILSVSWTRYAFALGAYSRHGVGLLSRQTLLGGDYEIINRTTGRPNPDYYTALLWHDLVGSSVYALDSGSSAKIDVSSNDCTKGVRLSAHDSATAGDGDDEVVVVAVNFALQANCSVELDFSTEDEDVAGSLWQLTGHPRSNRIFLNGAELRSSSSAVLPKLDPVDHNTTTLVLPPASVSFLRISTGGVS